MPLQICAILDPVPTFQFFVAKPFSEPMLILDAQEQNWYSTDMWIQVQDISLKNTIDA